MPRSLRSVPSPPRRRACLRRNAAAQDPETDLLLQDVEKRGLILAHAARREERPEGRWGLGYIAAVTMSVLVVTTGWMLTFGGSLNVMAPPRQDQLLKTIDQAFDQHAQDLQQGRDVIGNGVKAAQANVSTRVLQEQVVNDAAARVQDTFRNATSTPRTR